MRYIVLHESDKRIRIKTPILNMSMRQADLLEYYLKSIPRVRVASVDERTGNATITFRDSLPKKRVVLDEALSTYDETAEEVALLVPEETGRALNREYQEKLVFKVLFHNLSKIILPLNIRIIKTYIKCLPFLFNATKAFLSGKLKVETLDGIAIAASIYRGDYSTASSIMFLLESGEILEEWTRKKSIGDLARSMSLNIDKVWVKSGESEIQVPINQVNIGDYVIVRTSDVIPLDGKLFQGEFTVNQSTMTGESEPVLKCVGGYVYAGTVVEEGQGIIEVTKKSGTGKYDQIVHMIEESEKLKSDTEARAYRLADSLVPYSFLGFGITALITRNLTKALSFLMVDYSCAMKLSMPLSVLSAIKEAREYGISIKGGKFMEIVSEADTIIFDKTGTLTYATPKLMEVITFGGESPDEMLRVAACLEEHYPHSVANAIVNGALEKNLNHEELHSKVEYIVAHGVSSFIGEKKAVIGSYHFVMEDEGATIPEAEGYKLDEIKKEYSRVFLAIDGVLTAVLCIFDPVRDEAKETISALHKLGISNICMMTGDNKKTAANVAKALGIDQFQAEVLPEDKALFVQNMRKQGHKVIMVGDGVNDSPALSEADAGIAIESGAAIAKEIADITISSENLEALVVLRKISKELMNRINDNYRFIVGFNSTLIGLGLTGLISPSASALLHNSSTIMTGVKSTTKLIDSNNDNYRG